jgi:hypothetical protein
MGGRVSQEGKALAVLIFVTVAIVGYLAGHGRSTAATAEGPGEASNAATTLTYSASAGWQPVPSIPKVPGLALAQPVALAPAGEAARGGLIVGRLLGVDTGPLPEQLLAHLQEPPKGEVVELSNTQAYRYSGLRLAGDGRELTLYTIPISPTSVTVIACYASPGFSRYLRACEQLAGTLTIATGRPQSEVRSYYSLTPAVRYGRQIGAVIARVESLLLALRAQIQPGAARATASALATRLASGLAGAAGSLSVVPPPPAMGRVHAALADSLRRASAAYAALAAAVSAGDTTAYAAARTEIYIAEAGLSAALRDFALRAYN